MMSKYECQTCHKTYNKKEYDLMNKDYCSHDCMMVARRAIKERKEPVSARLPHIVGGGGGHSCF